MSSCKKCNIELTGDEIALHKKLIDRYAEEFFCLDCCAEYFQVKRKTLENKIAEYKAWGCTLFPENQVDIPDDF